MHDAVKPIWQDFLLWKACDDLDEALQLMASVIATLSTLRVSNQEIWALRVNQPGKIHKVDRDWTCTVLEIIFIIPEE